MKLSSQAIVLCTVLVATSTSTVSASDRKLIRNKKGRTTVKRNLIKVEAAAAATPTLEEIVQIDDAELVRALGGADGGRIMMMSMTMSMPSTPSGENGGDSEDDNSGGGDSTGGSDSDSDSDSDGSSSGGDDGDSSGTDGSTDVTVDISPAASPVAVPSDPISTSTDGPLAMAPTTESPPAMAPSPWNGGGEMPASGPLEAPTGGDSSGVDPEEESSSASRRNMNVAVAAVVTTAMIVPFLL